MDTGFTATQTRWLGIVEALAALIACVGTIAVLGAVLAVLLAPRVYSAEFELVQRPTAGPQSASEEALVQQVEQLGLPGEVRTRERRGKPILLLTGLDSAEQVEILINEVLIESGYQPTAAVVRTGFDGIGMVTRHPVLTLGLQSAILLVFGGVLYRWRVAPAAPDRVASPPVAVGAGLLAGVAGFVSSLVIALLQQLAGVSMSEQAWLMELLSERGTLLTIIPWVVAIVPFAEEVFFRGYFFRFLLQRSGAAVAYLLSAGCFSLIHLHLPGLLVYFAVGLLFAYVCRRTATLTAPVVAHMTYNGLALSVSLLTMSR